MNPAPVGIFDSGMGGLSVAREIRAVLPSEPLLYLADTAYCPYGDRSVEEIRSRSAAAVGHLVRLGVKAVVVACNTATGAALEELRDRFPLPIVGLEPAVKPAAALTRNGCVAVMATVATLRSERFERLVRTYAADREVVRVPCPGLVELVEAGDLDGPTTLSRLERLLAPVRSAGADTVVLGCTHYPFLRDAIASVMGPGVQLVDSGRAIARRVERVLQESDDLAPAGPASVRLLTTAHPSAVRDVAERLWGCAIEVDHVDLAPAYPAASQVLSSGAAPSPASSR